MFLGSNALLRGGLGNLYICEDLCSDAVKVEMKHTQRNHNCAEALYRKQEHHKLKPGACNSRNEDLFAGVPQLFQGLPAQLSLQPVSVREHLIQKLGERRLVFRVKILDEVRLGLCRQCSYSRRSHGWSGTGMKCACHPADRCGFNGLFPFRCTGDRNSSGGFAYLYLGLNTYYVCLGLQCKFCRDRRSHRSSITIRWDRSMHTVWARRRPLRDIVAARPTRLIRRGIMDAARER